MSYSRWNHSCWYTFWACSNSDVKEDQIFEVNYQDHNGIDFNYRSHFTYGELKDLGDLYRGVFSPTSLTGYQLEK